MANGGYSGGHADAEREPAREHKYRTPDDGLYSTITFSLSNQTDDFADRKYVSGITSPNGKVEVINQRRSIYDREAPRTGDASSELYRKEERERKHKHKSSHRH